MAVIKSATFQDLESIAICHCKAFPHALSSKMGLKYVKKMLEWYLVEDRAFMFFLSENNKCLGYVGGLKFDAKVMFGSASNMIQHSFYDAINAFLLRPWLFFHPEFIAKYKLAWKNVVKRFAGNRHRHISLPKDHPTQQPHTGLIVIGVDPVCQGQGFGSFLLREFERVSKELGYNKLLLTVKTENVKAIKSYQQNGWIIIETTEKSMAMAKQLY